jgi:hypothetical protein
MTWQERHYAAIWAPTEQEQPIVQAINAAAQMAESFGSDFLLREGLAQTLCGLQKILEFNWGERLDRGMLDRELIRIASSINYSLELEAFI